MSGWAACGNHLGLGPHGPTPSSQSVFIGVGGSELGLPGSLTLWPCCPFSVTVLDLLKEQWASPGRSEAVVSSRVTGLVLSGSLLSVSPTKACLKGICRTNLSPFMGRSPGLSWGFTFPRSCLLHPHCLPLCLSLSGLRRAWPRGTLPGAWPEARHSPVWARTAAKLGVLLGARGFYSQGFFGALRLQGTDGGS